MAGVTQVWLAPVSTRNLTPAVGKMFVAGGSKDNGRATAQTNIGPIVGSSGNVIDGKREKP